MSIKNFKNPWVDNWAEGEIFHPDWLGGEKALENDKIQIINPDKTIATIEKLEKLMVSRDMKDAFKYLVDYSPTFVSFLAKFDNPQMLEGNIKLLFKSSLDKEYYGAVVVYHNNKNLKLVEKIPDTINLSTIHILIEIYENRYDWKSEPENTTFKIIADTIVTLTHELTLHLERNLERIKSSIISNQNKPPIYLSGSHLLTTYKNFLATDSDHKLLYSNDPLPLYDAVRDEVIEGLKKLKSVYCYKLVRDENGKVIKTVYDDRRDLGFQANEKSGDGAKYKLHLWELVQWMFKIDKTKPISSQ